MDAFHLRTVLDNFYIERCIHAPYMIAHDMYRISLVELDAPVLKLPKFRPSSEVPSECTFRLPGKKGCAEEATDKSTSVM